MVTFFCIGYPPNIYTSLLIIAFGPFIIGLDMAILFFIFCILLNFSIRISGGISCKINDHSLEGQKNNPRNIGAG